MHVHFSQRAVANGNVAPGSAPPPAVASGGREGAARRRRPTGCTANALLMNWCPNQGRAARGRAMRGSGLSRTRLSRMTGMTSTSVRDLEFGLALPGISFDGMHVHTDAGNRDLPRCRLSSFSEGHAFSTCDPECAYRRSIV